MQATRRKKKIRVDEHAGWERTSVVGIVSRNKKLVELKRKVCRLGMKLYEASIEKFFPSVCLLLRFSLLLFPFLSPSVYLSLYKQADFELKRDTSNGEGFPSRRVQRKGNGTTPDTLP